MKALFFAVVAVLIALFVAPAPAAAMQQSHEMAAQAKHHKSKHHSVVHRAMHHKQGSCRHKGHC